MSSTTSRAARLAAGVLAGGLTLLPLTACSFSSDTLSCSGSECTVTLSGSDAEVEILGTSLSFGGVQDGRASLSVGNASVSCAQGETVSAGPLTLTCTTVETDSVEVTASLG
ncbi:hypothetical protein SAMN05660209_03012 [Geodermatophilus africanus]|jgi:hypothetical protein|uniref:Uncharacterized protein n=1 Tax=Geodermatophilus africanus TaxID=1137993 RepID=A0A1H3KCU3_9ACTN|nr:hypothetical protein [Geodermatophilus africanus]SDY49354.1 hypothetical protein SAMN05660209_03012 [Geodermatophilus africanus]